MQSRQNELSNAQSKLAYRRAQTRRVTEVRNGKTYYYDVPVDTTSEQNAVAHANQHLSNANRDLANAKHQEEAARELLNAKIRRVATCERATKYANIAINEANVLEDDSTHAHIKSQTALNLINDIEQGCKAISALYTTVEHMCETADINIIDLKNYLEIEATIVQNLSRNLEVLERNSFHLKQTLDEKASLLLSFNQPISRI